MKITKGTTVTIHYDLFTEDGECVESTRDEDPVRYQHGDEEVLPGLEEALLGHVVGDEVRVTLAPEDAYGDYNPEGLVSLPRDQIDSAEEEANQGDWITVTVTETEDGEDGELDMRIVEIHDDEFILDANHPLAGQTVTFVVEVLAVEATD